MKYNPFGGIMDSIQLAYTVNPILIFIIAIGLGYYLIRRYHLGWRLFFVGGATYLGAQIASILLMGLIQRGTQSITLPLPVQLLSTLLFIIILYGIEEGIRYAMYRWWAKNNRSWAEGLLLGSGHGGVEVILIGLMALTTLVQLVSLRNADLATIFTADKLSDATKYVTTYWSKPWYNALAEAVRCALTLPIQLACSLLVLQVFLRKQYRWLGYAIGWHTLASTPLFYINSETYVYLPLIFLAVATLGSLGIIKRLQPQQERETLAMSVQ
jgi:uncharacterized membrane protein YhfC